MKLDIRANVRTGGVPLKHFWSVCVGAGRANEGLRAGWLEHLRLAHHQCGFEYVRFHGLFYDDMFVYRKKDGKEIYNWQYVDEVFDRMLDIGVRPFVELGPCPADLADPAQKSNLYWDYTFIWTKDFAKWGELIDKAVRHWIDRYGADEVRRWYFEVWNEPNIGFWGGTKSEYFQLYKATVLAIKGIDSALRVGGPATSNFVSDNRFDGEEEDFSKHIPLEGEEIDEAEWKAVWFEDFIRYCYKEGLPVDFVSTHPYPTNFAIDGHNNYKEYSRSVNSTRDDLAWIRRFVDNSPYPKAEIHLTEWSSSPCSRDHSHDCLPAAAFIVKTNLDSVGLADSLSYWTFTDIFEEEGGGASVFHGGFGMINYQGIVKPSFHAYRFLHLLGDVCIDRKDGCIVSKYSDTGKASLLLYNYPEKEVPAAIPVARDNPGLAESIQQMGEPVQMSLVINGFEPSKRFLMETLDGEHGYARRAWEKMGSPEPPDRVQTALLKEIANNLKKEIITADEAGVINLNLSISAWNVVSIREL